MDRPVPASFWRGGTSRAVLFGSDDLAGYRPEQIEAIILAALGSPDPDGRQIDGLGGGISSLCKAAVVGPAPAGSGADVAFRFAQVEVTEPRVDFAGNCGNISAAIAPFAVGAGLVTVGGAASDAGRASVAVEVLSLNTGQRFRTRVPLRSGAYDPAGDFAIGGVPGTGARLTLEYLDPGGSIGRGALPTGLLREDVEVPGFGAVPVSILDVGNPAVFVAASALGIPEAAAALPADLDADAVLQDRLERIRCEAAVRIGVAASPADATRHHRTVPKVALVGAPAPYRSTSGCEVSAPEVDLLMRLISMGRTHRTLAMTGAMACAAAAVMDGSVVAEAARGFADGSTSRATPDGSGRSVREAAGGQGPGAATDRVTGAREVRLGHPAGVLSLNVAAERSGEQWHVPSVTMDRTAREIMRGSVQVPQDYLDGEAWFASGSPS